MIFVGKEKGGAEGGFGLVEILVATGIIAVTFVVLMSLFVYNIRMEFNSRNRIVAAYLAQEAMEGVKQIRDDNWFADRNWDDGLRYGNGIILASRDLDNPSAGYELAQASAARKQKVYLRGTGAQTYYVQSNSALPQETETDFKRELTLTKITTTYPDGTTADDTIKVEADVSFSNGSSNPSHVRTVCYLYKWLK